MGTVYVTQDEAFIAKTDERLHVKAEKKTILDVPLIKIEGVVVVGRATISPAAIAELVNRKIPLTFLTSNGKYIARLEPELTKNLFVRKAQWKASDSTQALHLVRGFVRGKLKNYRNVLMRQERNFTELNLESAIARIEGTIASIDRISSIDSIRGLEGAGSAAYFGSLNDLIKVPDFSFATRNRRPPTDPVNSLLSLGYALLRHDVQSALNIVGFDPYLGYLHTEHYGRPSLALDLMEEFRALIVDAVVLSAINLKIIFPTDFTTEPLSGAVSLTKDGLHKFLRLYEQKKQTKFKHPVLGQQRTYQEAFEVQARLVAKYLMGEIEKYPPLIVR